MHREDIKAALRKQGWTLTACAKELGVEQSTISGILLGRRSKRIELWISRKISRHPWEVFPDRYSEEDAA